MGCWNPFLDSHGQQVKSGASASAALDKIDIAAWSHTAMVGGTVCNIESLDPIEVWKCPHWKNQGRDGFSKVFHRSVFFLKDDAELIMMGWIIWDDTWDSIWDAQRVISAIHWAFIRNPLTSVLLEHPICCPADGGAENVHVLRRVFYSSRLGSKNRPQRLREKILHKDWRADVWLVLYPLISHEFPLYPSFSWMVQRAKLRQLFAMGWSDSLWPAWRLSGSALTPLVHYIEFDQSYLPIK